MIEARTENRKHKWYSVWLRVLYAFVIYVSTALISTIAAGFIGKNMINPALAGTGGEAIAANIVSILSALFLILLLFIIFHFMDKKHKSLWREMGFVGNRSIVMTICGFAFAFALVLLYVFPLHWAAQLHITLFPFDAKAAAMLFTGLCVYASVSFAEEILFRGYIQYSLSKKYKSWSVLFTALLFALIHLTNTYYTSLSLIYLFIAGIALSLMRTETKGIWFPLGFHLAWNWAETTVFGVGMDNSAESWLITTVSRKTIWTGYNGTSGLAVIFAWFLAALIMLYSRKKTARLVHDQRQG